MNWAIDNLTALMINGLADVADLVSDRDSFVRKARTQAATGATSYDVYISSARHEIGSMQSLRQHSRTTDYLFLPTTWYAQTGNGRIRFRWHFERVPIWF